MNTATQPAARPQTAPADPAACHSGRRRGASVLALAALVGGCGMLPGLQPDAGPPRAEHFATMPDGSLHSYWRTATGSLGSGERRIDWTLSRDTWQGRAVLRSVSPQAGTTLYDAQTHAMVANLNAAGEILTTFDPPAGFRFPLVVGDQWTSQHLVTQGQTGRSFTLTMQWAVQAYERITVPAGSFDAWRIVSTDSLGETQRLWSNPNLGLGTIKREVTRPASHPAGAGTLVGELIAVRRGP